jgi:hypothetical protein
VAGGLINGIGCQYDAHRNPTAAMGSERQAVTSRGSNKDRSIPAWNAHDP